MVISKLTYNWEPVTKMYNSFRNCARDFKSSVISDLILTFVHWFMIPKLIKSVIYSELWCDFQDESIIFNFDAWDSVNDSKTLILVCVFSGYVGSYILP